MNSAVLFPVYFFLFLFGAAVFSFCNVAACRLPEHKNFISGRSMCPKCGKTLKWYHTVPVFSYLLLRGKCAWCGERIAPRYLLCELVGGGLSMLAFSVFCGGVASWSLFTFGRYLLVFAAFAVLCVVALVDGATMEIPNGPILILAGLGVIACFLFPETGLLERGIGIFCVSVPFLLFSLAIEGAFGGGDIKLMAACGLFLGWKLTLVALFFALMTGGAYGAYLLLTGKKGRKDHFAFGPFLCSGVAASALAGGPVLAWYLGFFTLV